jgi:hypothetical protein
VRVAYFVHDLNDAAVARRIGMLATAGIGAVVFGFWRGHAPPAHIGGAPCIPLGRSFDGKLAQRALLTVRNAFWARTLLARIGHVDLLMARNLEMLAVASAASRQAGGMPLVYEALDLHRLLLSPGIEGRIFRALERRLMRNAALLMTSSPAFLREYYEATQLTSVRVPTLLVENKVFHPSGTNILRDGTAALPSGPPWRIGWLGMLRCRRSLELLRDLAARRPDLVRVEIHGKPSEDIFPDFQAELADVPALHFGGPYAPAELDRLYRGMHFSWAIDYFEENGNSEWLLPNRIYEGGLSDAVPLALRRNEVGRWLGRLGLGVLLNDPASELEAFLETLTPEAFARLKAASCAAPREAFIADRSDCERLAAALAAAVRRWETSRCQGAALERRTRPVRSASGVPRGK